MAGLTLASMVSQVRSEIIEPTAGFWTDTEIKGWINDACADLTKSGRIERTPSTFTTTAGTESYTPPTDFYAMRRVEVQANSSSAWLPLISGTVEEHTPSWFLLTNMGQGFPRSWFVYNEKLYLIPTPDAAYTVKLWYYARATTLTADGDTPIFDQDYHTLLVKYAIAMAKRKQDDPGWTQYASEYNGGRNQFINEMAERRNGARYNQVVDDWSQLS